MAWGVEVFSCGALEWSSALQKLTPHGISEVMRAIEAEEAMILLDLDLTLVSRGLEWSGEEAGLSPS